MQSKEKRRLLQSLGGVYPCNHWRMLIGLRACGLCALCGHLDTFSHRMLRCSAVHEAVTAAHDKVWATLFPMICSHLPPGWTTWKDKVVSTTTVPCLSLASLKPDGLLWHKEDKLIHVLEFKHTTDFFPDSFERGFLRKFIKYTPLVRALETANKEHMVCLFVFTLGD